MYGPSGTTLSHHSHHNDIHELQEISENSESETDGHTSSGNSWKECRMTVSTNSDSECSTIPDARTPDRDMLHSSTEHYSLSDGLITGTQSPTSQEYTYSYPGKSSRSVRSVGSDHSEHEEYNFSRQNSGFSDISVNSGDMSRRPSNFDRYDIHRSSDVSNISSAFEVEPQNSLSDSGSDMFQRSDALRQSDMSDTSGISDANGLPNELPEAMINKNVEPVPNESGFHSEVTSSNQSDASQQSIDVTKLTHKELANRINADVQNHREKLEMFQKESLATSRQEAMALRKEFHTSLQHISGTQQQINGHPSDDRSVVEKRSSSEGKRPPPIPQKPKSFQTFMENPSPNSPQSANENNTHSLSAQQFNNVNSIVSKINSLAAPKQKLQTPNISAFSSSSPRSKNHLLKNDHIVDRPSIQSLANGSVTRDVSSFLNSIHSQNQPRPDSKMSVSSSASSIVTVIHNPQKPMTNSQVNYRPSQTPSPMHNSQTSTPEIPESPVSGGGNGHPLHDISFNSSHSSLRGASPKSILNSSPSCLREMNRKPKKRVSFSDSEPSDLESSSTQNSNRASPVTPVSFPINPADRYIPNNVGTKQPIRITGNHFNKTTNQYLPMKTFGNGSVPSAMDSYYMNGTVRTGAVVNGNQKHSAMEPRNSAHPTYKANMAPNVGNPGGPGTRTSDQIRQLYYGRGGRSQVLQSSKC